MILIKSFLTGVLYDCFKLIYTYLNKGKKVRQCNGCLKMIQAHLYFVFFQNIFYKICITLRILYKKQFQPSAVFKEKIIMKCLTIKIFA